MSWCVWREKAIRADVASGNTVRTPPAPSLKSAAAGVDALICVRTCSSSVVTLCVVKSARGGDVLRDAGGERVVERRDQLLR